mmetsp:Transcript_14086/g.48531  ORF Transcript_14086/g.48531 Transcript_14086/m.48531 type:complete len:97 (-) Transcript_14086:286-576(-)
MSAWQKDQGIPKGSIITMLADTQAALTEALDIVLTTHPGPAGKLGAHTKRCKRAAYYVDNGVIKIRQIAEAEDDPAGDDRPEASCIDNMLSLIEKL